MPDRDCEDLGCVFIDIDADGDQDLYVVSGGTECEPGDEVLRDRLYLNDGAGGFTKLAAPDALPDIRSSGSCVAAADYDRDGDIDLFVGGRVIPGAYPQTPQSQLLINHSGNGQVRLVLADESRAPGLANAGMVTGAVWSDANNDGWLDLLVTYEWGPVRLYLNNHGVLRDTTEAAGLAHLEGWWNSITAADLDHDGDMDYVVTNWGLNTKYHASEDHPYRVYYDDFDQKRPT